IIVVRLASPIDPNAPHLAAMDRPIVRFEELDLRSGKVRTLQLDIKYRFASAVADNKAIVERTTENNKIEYQLFDLQTAQTTAVVLTNSIPYYPISLAVVPSL